MFNFNYSIFIQLFPAISLILILFHISSEIVVTRDVYLENHLSIGIPILFIFLL